MNGSANEWPRTSDGAAAGVLVPSIARVVSTSASIFSPVMISMNFVLVFISLEPG
jgi:hypothetical protein